MASQKIFFSYSRVDGAAHAIRLATDLKKQGFDVWIDQEDIRAGLEWDTEIEKALQGCDYLLFMATEKSVVSNNVLDEVYYALEQNKKVIPLIFANINMPFRLNRLQHIDFTKNYGSALTLLVNELHGKAADISYASDHHAPSAIQAKPLVVKKYKALFITAGIAVLIALGVVFAGKTGKKTVLAGQTDHKEAEIKLTDIAEGEWSLIEVEPKAQSQSGYLKIEALSESKAGIKAYVQFYYPDSKASSSLSVFNAFVGCTSCVLSKEMKLKVEDIAVSSRSIVRAQEDQADGKKAGDTISDASSTRSIYGTATLQFLDSISADIIVKQSQTVVLNKGLKLEPFVYTFHFKKKG